MKRPPCCSMSQKEYDYWFTPMFIIADVMFEDGEMEKIWGNSRAEIRQAIRDQEFIYSKKIVANEIIQQYSLEED